MSLLFVLEYRGGLAAAVYLLNGLVRPRASPLPVPACRTVSTEIWLQPGKPFSHSSGLTYYIEQLVVNGAPPTSGADAADHRCYSPHGILIPQALWRRRLSCAYRAPADSLFNRGGAAGAERL